MGIEDDKIVRGRIPWKGSEAPKEAASRNTYLNPNERPIDFSDMEAYLKAAERRAAEILSITSGCDLSRAEELRDSCIDENQGQALTLAQRVTGASDEDIEFDPEGHRAIALAFIQVNNPPHDI